MTAAGANSNPGKAGTAGTNSYDAIIIGAGISGMYQLHRLRQLGLKVRVFEAGQGVGGTWYWNRYPGARFDSESYSYGYSFSKDVLQEWSWSEHFASQPETLRYLNFVADKFDFRADIVFGARVLSAIYDEDTNVWRITLDDETVHSARLLISAVGPLSTTTLPKIDGIAEFRGESYHTGLWPQEPVSFAGKRVAVIGTGASGIQTIQEVAKTAGSLTVFQRTPNWCAPLGNSPIDSETQTSIKAGYDEIFARCNQTLVGFMHTPDPRSVFDVTPEERERFLEELYARPGFAIWQANFRDAFSDRQANAVISEFAARKIRERVHDPEVARKLIPTNHGFGTRRVPMETNYYEVYNQPNVTLVDIRETPIERVTPNGIRTSRQDFEFDMIIYATGFDAITGSLDRIDIRGRGGVSLRDRWANGLKTFLGLMVEGMPNFLMVMGPHTVLGNIPRTIEYIVNWNADLIRHMLNTGAATFDVDPQAVIDWTGHVEDAAEGLLVSEVDSWLTGVNTNVEGRQTRSVVRYCGGAPAYRAHADAVASAEYRELHFRSE